MESVVVSVPSGLLDMQLWLHIRPVEQGRGIASGSLEVHDDHATYKGFLVLFPLHKQPG